MFNLLNGPATIFNDLHIGVKRNAGTTKKSRADLERGQFSFYRELLADVPTPNLIILGDLFDKSVVSQSVLWATYELFSEFLDTGKELVLVTGNHDAHNRSDEMCSLALLGFILAAKYDNVVTISKPISIYDNIQIIPSLQNQDIFDLAVDQAHKDGIGTLLLHCNYDNFFATDSDHSLNLSAEQGSKFDSLIFAHEHSPRNIKNAHILGCQFPTSVADCLHGGELSYTVLHEDGKLERTPCLDLSEIYEETDWKELGKTEAKFIRVSGNATVEEAGDAVRAISSFRKKSDAFVITNAVQIEGMVSDEEISDVTERLASLNTTQILYDLLKDWQVEAIKAIVVDTPIKLREIV